MKSASYFVLSALMLAVAGLPAAAQKFQPKTIQFKGDPEYNDQELLVAAGLKKGTVLNYAEMNEHSKRLMDSGMFDGLTFKFDGVDLIFMLTPAEHLFPVRLENLPLTQGKELDAKLHELFPLYHGKVPGEDGLREDVREALEALLAAKGLKVTIEASNVADPKHRSKVATVTYSISSPAVHLGAVTVDGVSDRFQSRIQGLTHNFAKAPFTNDNTAADLEKTVTLFYQDQDYAAAEVHAAPSGDAVASADAILVPFSLSVREGKMYKLGTVQLPPNANVSDAEANKILHSEVPAGAVVAPTANSTSAHLISNTPSGFRLRALWSMVMSRCKAKGNLDCIVTPHPAYDDANGIVNYTVAIDPGPVYHLGFVKFDNVSDSLRSLLIRNWQMLPGDPFDEGYVSNFILTAQQHDPVLLRTLIGVKTSFDANADPVTHDVNVVVHLSR